jgi:hypothetical protein
MTFCKNCCYPSWNHFNGRKLLDADASPKKTDQSRTFICCNLHDIKSSNESPAKSVFFKMDLFITGNLGSFTVVSTSLVRCYDCVGESPARGGNSRTGLHHAFKFIQLLSAIPLLRDAELI